jgi:hypothetical protein
MDWHICNDCGSDKLVECVQDGDLVCSNCGLVKMGHLIDDTYKGNCCFDENGGTMHDVFKECQENVAIQQMPNSYEYRKEHCSLKRSGEFILGIDNSFDVNTTSWTLFLGAMNKSCKGKRGDKKQAVLAASMYCACKMHKRGIQAQIIYSYFNIPLWKDFTEICSNWSDVNGIREALISISEGDALKRMIYDNSDIPDDKLWLVVKNAYVIKDKLNGSLDCMVKASKLNACLIYIACSIVGCKMSKQNIKDIYGVTPVTLKKHETMIQLCLEKSM